MNEGAEMYRMKRYIISGIIGAVAMFLLLLCIANLRSCNSTQAKQPYEHEDLVSEITEKECYICGSVSDFAYWGEDNVAILNLNTFEMHRLEINRYDAHGQLITEPAGVMVSGGMHEDDTYVNSFAFPDEGYARVEITNLKYEIDRGLVQSKLCQICLDTINDLWFGDIPPAEIAVVSLAERKMHPLIDTSSWFSVGEYGVDCEYEEDGDIDLLIHYIASRYSK